ncbi:hypothetical protein [Thermicanus aegyptius]|uniref:hypothetical protein n=1 Tax=Thermicanus aegyptius TaxID=94009 RepID=UPI0004289798|nr:hypothetical protein [Thermicanus aegyptius]
MIRLRETDHVVKVTELEDLGEKILKDLAVYYKNTYQCQIQSIDMRKAIKIIRNRSYGRISITGKCKDYQKDKLFIQIRFIHRKGIVAVKVSGYNEVGWSEGSLVRSRTRKKIMAKTIDPDLIWKLRDVLILMIDSERFVRLKNYLEYRRKREKLTKASKCGIDVGEFKEVLKSDYFYKCHPEIESNDEIRSGIEFIDFEEPFLLVGTPEKHILLTPFGKYEASMEIHYAREAFRELVNVKRVPYGKDAMKKIEALLLQASI